MPADPLARAAAHAAAFLDGLDERHVAPTATLDALRARIGVPLPEQGEDAAAVVDRLAADCADGLMASTGPRFYGWVVGGALPAALGADWLLSAWDQNAGIYATSPALAVVEETCAAWVLDVLGLPASAGVGFVTGCQMAHFTCLAAARNELYARRGHDVEVDGLAGAPALRVLTSRHRHATLDRALRLLGIGSGAIEEVATTAGGELDVAALDRALAASDRPAIVVLQAGEINTGFFDPFGEAIAVARRHGAWAHVDGAFGLWAAASPAERHHVAGAEAADSWATDGHKWANVPYDCGLAIVADRGILRRTMGATASYIELAADGRRDSLDTNPEWSRRGRGVPLYAALRSLGRRGVADLVDRTCRLTARLVDEIGALDGAEVVSPARINQGLVRFPDPFGVDDDARTERVAAAIAADGAAFFTPSTWEGRRVLRISVCGYRTTDADVDRTVEGVRRALAVVDAEPALR
jgi:glutamate/tyrosine decarboxylase-like PLP-dependent enzyme